MRRETRTGTYEHSNLKLRMNIVDRSPFRCRARPVRYNNNKPKKARAYHITHLEDRQNQRPEALTHFGIPPGRANRWILDALSDL